MSVVSGRKSEEGSLVVQVASTLSTILVSPSLPRLLMNLLLECDPKNGTRGEESSFRKENTFERWKIEGDHDSRLVVELQCQIFWSLEDSSLVNDGVMYRFSMTHCWNSTGKREGGKSSLNVNDNLVSIRARIVGELSRALYLEISLSKD